MLFLIERMPSHSKNKKQIQTRGRKNKQNKTRKYIKGGDNPFTTHVKAMVYNSKVRPGKPFYKIFVFDEINKDFFKSFQKFMLNTVDETEEDLIAIRESWNTKKNDKGKTTKEPNDVIVYGFKVMPPKKN